MFVADLHNDVLQRAIIGEDISKLTTNGHSDIVRLISSCIDLEVFVIWITGKYLKKGPFKRANELIDKLEYLEKQDLLIKIVKNIDEILIAKKTNILSTPFSLEGGEAIEESIDNLLHFIKRGLLYFGFTWNHSLSWVSSSYDETYNKKNIACLGLNKFGQQVVHTCNESGIIIDVSHIGEKSFWDIVKFSSKPFIASHSSVYSLCNHFRNLKDNQILAIKKAKGLIGLNPYPCFIDPIFEKKKERFKKENFRELQKIILSEKDKANQWIKKQHYLQKALQSITPSIELFVDHIEYIIRLIGIDYVGIGSDYDGLDCLPKELNDCCDHILIIRALERRRYTTLEIEKIMGLNFLRVYEEVKS